jgi:hypothetical protein|tara:strand:- start:199 stop:348 length:150 start_codon:yes stop_codon:yes gene_type:complete
MKSFWGYINTNGIWYAWYFVDKIPQEKLGPFETNTEARQAVKEYEDSNK